MTTIKSPVPAPTFASRGQLAAGPISWGVCEVPGWGAQLPPERVLSEMRSLGIEATEAGPVGYLGDDAVSVGRILDAAGIHLVGAFLPVVIHAPSALAETLAAARQTAALLAANGASHLISAAVVDRVWSPRVELDPDAWRHAFETLERLDEVAAEAGVQHVLHPHVNTIVERDDDLRRVLEGSEVRLCLDTGHLTLGGTDIAELVRDAATRIGHVHLKDVRLTVAARMYAGELDLVGATRHGLFCALGDGDAPLEGALHYLDEAGYTGWYVLEQDTTLESTDIPEGTGPIDDVRRSIAFLNRLVPSTTGAADGRRG